MQKYLLLLLAIAIGAAGSVEARRLSVAEATGRIKTGTKKTLNIRAERMTLKETVKVADRNVVYVMNKPSGGAVFLAADDNLPAVLGYTDGAVDANEPMPENLKWWLAQYANTLDGNPQRVNESEESYYAESALMTTLWGQTGTYAKKTPNNWPTGCVATAMAQIMKYHEHPTKGTGSHSYKLADGTEVSSDFESHTYAWDKMIKKHFTSTAEQNDAVSQLMYDCGVSVDMAYAQGASGSATNGAAYAFYTYFGYDKGVRNCYRAYMSEQEWEDMLIAEMQAKRPVLYGSSSMKEGGHAFVCDGYDGNGYFHFNWGWEGQFNGYFNISGTNPLNPYSIYPANPWSQDDNYGFSHNQLAIIGIQPDKGSEVTPEGMLGLPGGYKLTDYYGSDATTVNNTGYVWVYGDLCNIGVTPMTATLGARFENEDHTFVAAAMNAYTYVLGQYYVSYYFPLTNVAKNGTYKVYPVFLDSNAPEKGWQDMKYPEGTTIPTLTVTGGEKLVAMAEQPYLTSGGRHTADNKVTADDMTLHVTVDVYEEIEGGNLVAYVLAKGEYTSLARFRFPAGTLSVGRHEFHLSEMTNIVQPMEAGKEYRVRLQYYSEGDLTPNYWNYTPFTVVDQMPEPEANITDASPIIAPDTYGAGKVTYTRTGVTAETYESFCLPFDVVNDADKFVKLYVPSYNGATSNGKLMVQMNKKNAGDVIAAGTPFVAKMAQSGALVLKNNSELTTTGNETNPAAKAVTMGVTKAVGDTYTVTLGGTPYGAMSSETGLCGIASDATIGLSSTGVAAMRTYLTVTTSGGAAPTTLNAALAFDDIFTGIEVVADDADDEVAPTYNVLGIRVGDDYKGVVFRNGKKIVRK